MTTQRTYALIFAVSFLSTFGSLFFSEVLGFPPCSLCWYQRIFMYPLVILSAMAFIDKDTKALKYLLALMVPGLLISIYHNLLYYGALPASEFTCSMGISCTTQYIEWLGFVTIPFLSFAAFALMFGVGLYTWRRNRVLQED